MASDPAIAEWVDRLAIQELAVRYCDAVTRGDWDAFESVWAADAVWEESPPAAGRIVGGRNIRETMGASIDTVDFLVQVCHGVAIGALAGDRAQARTTIHAVARAGARSFLNYGIYFDELARSNGEWRYTNRRLQSVYADLDPLPGEPATMRAALGDTITPTGPATGGSAVDDTDVAARVAAWIDKQAIQELVIHYSDAATRGAWDEFAQMWTPDAVWEVAPPVDSHVEGRDAIMETVIGNLEGEDFLVQMTHGAVVTLHGNDRASSRTTIHAIARQTDVHAVTNYAVYSDDLVKTDGVWQFARRRLQNLYYDPRPLPGVAPITRAELASLGR